MKRAKDAKDERIEARMDIIVISTNGVLTEHAKENTDLGVSDLPLVESPVHQAVASDCQQCYVLASSSPLLAASPSRPLTAPWRSVHKCPQPRGATRHSWTPRKAAGGTVGRVVREVHGRAGVGMGRVDMQARRGAFQKIVSLKIELCGAFYLLFFVGNHHILTKFDILRRLIGNYCRHIRVRNKEQLQGNSLFRIPQDILPQGEYIHQLNLTVS